MAGWTPGSAGGACLAERFTTSRMHPHGVNGTDGPFRSHPPPVTAARRSDGDNVPDLLLRRIHESIWPRLGGLARQRGQKEGAQQAKSTPPFPMQLYGLPRLRRTKSPLFAISLPAAVASVEIFAMVLEAPVDRWGERRQQFPRERSPPWAERGDPLAQVWPRKPANGMAGWTSGSSGEPPSQRASPRASCLGPCVGNSPNLCGDFIRHPP